MKRSSEMEKKTYTKPEIIHEMDLETRAGSSPVGDVGQGFDGFEIEE